LGQNVKENYNAVQNVFLQFANSYQNGGRGDCFYISDIPRGILIKGKDTKITTLFGKKMEGTSYELGESVNHSFPTSIYYPIKHTFDNIVSSYMSTYAQWVKILDKHSAKKIWIPISGYIAANMCATDTVGNKFNYVVEFGVVNKEPVMDYGIIIRSATGENYRLTPITDENGVPTLELESLAKIDSEQLAKYFEESTPNVKELTLVNGSEESQTVLQDKQGNILYTV
jgi:hypothetical protein